MTSQTSPFQKLVLGSPQRMAMPIAMYPGLALTGAKVSDVAINARAQIEV